MRLVKHHQGWALEYQKIKEYIFQTLAIGEIQHCGLSAIKELPSLMIMDICITIPTLNDLPLVNDSLALSNYYLMNSQESGKYSYKNANLDFFPHRLFVVIKDSFADKKQEALSKLFNNVDFLQEYHEFLDNTLFGDITEEYYDKINDYFLTVKLDEYHLLPQPLSLVMPNFTNSIYNVSVSLKKHYGLASSEPSIGLVDEALVGKDHVMLVLIDGMGINIMKQHLPIDSFLRRHLKAEITSIFPATTVAATTTVQTGLLPGLSGWIGWQQYFSQVDKNIVMFRNEDYYTSELVNNFKVSEELPLQDIFYSFKNTNVQTLWPSFRENGFSNFQDMLEKAFKITKANDKSFTYLYWDELDYNLHEYGLLSPKIKNLMVNINNDLQNLAKKTAANTVMIIIADHGLLDTKPLYINRFKDLTNLFTHKPALEGRASAFYVKDKSTFRELFNRYFGAYFVLYTKEEFIAKGLLGTISEENIGFIGDFMAIAIDEYSIITHAQEECFKASHAGLTSQEMLVPLIIK